MELLKGIVNRLGIVLHWSGFIIFIFSLIMIIFATFVEPHVRLLATFFLAFSFWVGGWVLKFLLTGRKEFFPWK